VHKRAKSFIVGLSVGVLAGLMAGFVGAAYSATGKKAWDRFGEMFQAGYVAGFLDCVRIAKAMDYEGYVATNFTIPPGTSGAHFQAWINEEYKDPSVAERTLPQMLVLAGYKLQAKFGPEPPLSGDASMEALRAVIEARRAAVREAEQLKQTLDDAKATDAGAPDKKSPEVAPQDGGDAKPAD
jgi:hypothetical protein